MSGYQILHKLGLGSMAEVFLARLPRPDAPFLVAAIKRPLPHLLADPAVLDMFLDESRLASALRHPNIVRTLEVGEQDGEPYIAFEYVDGVDLQAVLKQLGPLPLPAALAVVAEVAEGLAFSHAHTDEHGAASPIVHRDISPENVLVGRAGQVKIIDFGIARAKGRLRKTAPGALLGKVDHMAPEQALARPAGPAADVFSLGTVLFTLVVGRPAFAGKTPRDRLDRLVRGTREPLPAGPSAGLEALVDAMLEKEPDRRPSAAQVAQRLDEELARLGQDRHAGLAALVAFLGALLPAASSFEYGTVTAVTPAREE